MKPSQLQRHLKLALRAAGEAGDLMRQNLRQAKRVNSASQHDIKLELDVRCQERITRTLAAGSPSIPVLGEEGVAADVEQEHRWVVDPIDGTVNFTYGIPHACVSIALQQRQTNSPAEKASPRLSLYPDGYQTVLGVVLDPFCGETWTGLQGQPATLNGTPVHVSRRSKLAETIVSLGFSKERQSLERMLPAFNQLIRRVRKIRMMGAAALGIVYVAGGRMDAYLEFGLRLWDIAAAGFIVECAGGEFWRVPGEGLYQYRVIAHNGLLRRKLETHLG